MVEKEHKHYVLGTKEPNRASLFYIFTTESPKVFNIAYFGRNESDQYTKPALHLSAHTRFGYDSGPLEVGSVDATDFILNHSSKDENSLSVEYWETDGCYIRLVPHAFKVKSFVGFDEENLKTICIRSVRNEGKRNIWLKFQLHRINFESTTNATTSPGAARDSVVKDNKLMEDDVSIEGYKKIPGGADMRSSLGDRSDISESDDDYVFMKPLI